MIGKGEGKFGCGEQTTAEVDVQYQGREKLNLIQGFETSFLPPQLAHLEFRSCLSKMRDLCFVQDLFNTIPISIRSWQFKHQKLH